METPFTKEETQKAVKTLKKGKSAGIDEIQSELLKHSPDIIYQRIAEIFKNMAKTGELPKEITQGILVPFPKPDKPQVPP